MITSTETQNPALHAATLRLLGLLASAQLEDELLQKGIEALALLLRARYGAIALSDDDGKLKQFVHTGIPPEEVACIGHLPEGRGLLGVTAPLRLDDLSQDPRAVGFPLNHPPMKSLLSVHFSYEGQTYGRVYLSEKQDGSTFSLDDEQLLSHFANVFAMMLSYHRSRARERTREQALRQSEAHYHLLAQLAPVGIFRADPAGHCTYVNQRWCDIAGISPEQACGEGWAQAIHPDDRKKIVEHWYAAAKNDQPFLEECRMRRPDGVTTWVLAQASAERDANGQVSSYVGTITDISEHKTAGGMLTRLGRILDASSNEIYVFDDATLRFIQVNQGAQRNLGYTLEELQTLTPLDLKPEFTQESFEIQIAPLRRGEESQTSFITSHRRKDGSTYPVEVRVHYSKSEHPPVFVAIVQDITERKRAEERLSHLAYYDALTNLPNRQLLNERLSWAMTEADSRDRLVAVMFLDLDRFKTINDTLGHDVGDRLLRDVAERLKTCVRPGDTVSRLGGDEFTIVLANVAHVDDVARVTQKILNQFVQPFRIGGRDLFASPSIGITLYPFDDNNNEGLLKNADTAMYHAKALGRNNFQFYTAELNARAARQLELETGMHHALERDEFILHYQPLVNMQTGRIVGMEALLRWQHPEYGLISPLEFIPLAEETGLIVPIGEWVLRSACAQIKAWHATGFPAMHVAVNLSSKQLLQKNFAQIVKRVLKETGLDPSYLDLELTESLLMQDMESAMRILQELKAMGVMFSLDDFGTGYSSLSYLKHFPIDFLKIDRSFVRDVLQDRYGAGIVRAIIAMAHTLEIKVIAEGVESSEQLVFLREQDCDITQGYYCSEPLAVETFTALLRDWQTIRQGECHYQKKAAKKPGRKKSPRKPPARHSSK